MIKLIGNIEDSELFTKLKHFSSNFQKKDNNVLLSKNTKWQFYQKEKKQRLKYNQQISCGTTFTNQSKSLNIIILKSEHNKTKFVGA
jgi:hypothetical protein